MIGVICRYWLCPAYFPIADFDEHSHGGRHKCHQSRDNAAGSGTGPVSSASRRCAAGTAALPAGYRTFATSATQLPGAVAGEGNSSAYCGRLLVGKAVFMCLFDLSDCNICVVLAGLIGLWNVVMFLVLFDWVV